MTDSVYGITVTVMTLQTHNRNVAGEVRAALARQGVTRAQAAAHLGLSHPTLARRLSGQSAFRVDELIELAALLDVPPSDFLSPRAAA